MVVFRKKKQTKVAEEVTVELPVELQELADDSNVTLHLDRDPNDPRNRDYGVQDDK